MPHCPPYVALCNFDEFWIYDFNTQLQEPVDRVPVADLPARHAALNFLFPRVGTDGAQALRYVLSTGPEVYRPEGWRPANPSQLLAVLLLAGARLGIGNTWDLRALDRRSSGFFTPANYREFGREVIENGMNYTHHVGFGVWTPADFAREFDRAIQQSLPPETAEFPKEGAALCTAASLLFPNRLPLLLERML